MICRPIRWTGRSQAFRHPPSCKGMPSHCPRSPRSTTCRCANCVILLLPPWAIDCYAVRRTPLPTGWRNGSLRVRPTGSILCRPGSRGPLTISLSTLCQSCRSGDCSALNMLVVPCVATLVFPARRGRIERRYRVIVRARRGLPSHGSGRVATPDRALGLHSVFNSSWRRRRAPLHPTSRIRPAGRRTARRRLQSEQRRLLPR